MWLGIVNKRRIVCEYRIPHFVGDLELAHRNRVSRAAETDRKLRQHPTRAIDCLQSPIGLEENDRCCLSRMRLRRDIRNHHGNAGFNCLPGVHFPKKPRARVKFFSDTFERRFVPEIRKLGALHHVRWDAYERTSSVLIRNGVTQEHRRITRPKRTPRVLIYSPAHRDPAHLLERPYRLSHVFIEGAADFSWGEPGVVEKNLSPHHRSTARTAAQQRRNAPVLDRRN